MCSPLRACQASRDPRAPRVAPLVASGALVLGLTVLLLSGVSSPFLRVGLVIGNALVVSTFVALLPQAWRTREHGYQLVHSFPQLA